MEILDLEREYNIAKETTSFSQHQQFIKQLLSSDKEEIVTYHFELLKRKENWELYQRIRYAFIKRGTIADNFLINRIKIEKDPELQADILQLLGGLKSKQALPLARDFIKHKYPEHRHRACFVLGWVGVQEDIDILSDRLFNDPKHPIRGTAATALRQLWGRLPDMKMKILINLKKALETEEDEDAVKRIIISIQTIMKKRFGLKENIEEREITGDVDIARKRTLKALTLI
ncbi:MAG: HEAT repeat domain-containing protein [Deltaproteobacteria bacterium]|nr:HEAT repeat domain-containing protein [Deltaproteobacteria bacterium]